MSHNPQSTIVIESDFARKVRLARADANATEMVHVDWTDLEHYLAKARQFKDKESFDIAIRVLQQIRLQVVGK